MNYGRWFGTFFHILGIIIPTDFHIFQRGLNHQPDSDELLLDLLGDYHHGFIGKNLNHNPPMWAS